MEEKRINDDVELYLASDDPVDAENKPATEDEPTVDPISVIKNAPKVVRVGEVLEFRERNKKRFKMSDGTEQEVFYASDVHVLDDEAGRYDDIEDTLTEDEDGTHLVCGKHCFIAKFSNDEKNDELFSIEQGKHKVIVLAKKNYKNKNKGKRPDVRKRDFDSESESKIVSFSEIESDSIYEYTVESDGVKENIVVKCAKETYRYPFILKCENVKAVLDAGQKRIAFTDLESEEEVFHIPAPFMVDSNNIVSKAVSYELTTKGKGDPILTVIADSEWMNAEERTFPVVIDPQIKVTNASLISVYKWEEKEGTPSISAAVGNLQVGVSTDSVGTPDNPHDHSGTVNNNNAAINLIYNQWFSGKIPNRGDSVWYKFVANAEEAHNGESVGSYTFYTTGSLDTVGFLYDSQKKKIKSNDDSNGLNFAISADLTCGETYYLEVKAYGTNVGSYKVSCISSDRYCCGDDLPTSSVTHVYTRRRMYMAFAYANLPIGARIKKAKIEVKGVKNKGLVTHANAKIGLYHIDDELSTSCDEPTVDGNLIDYDTMIVDDSNNITYSFDITAFIDRLHNGEGNNNNFALKLVDETLPLNNYIELYGTNAGENAPQLVIEYEPSYAVNTSYQSHTHQIGKFGQAAIDLQYGNLTFDSTDFSWSGNRMPVTIKHLYNSLLGSYKHTYNSGIKLYVADFSAMNVGYGFKLNIMQSVRLVGDEYIYTDENGAETALKLENECTYNNEDGDMSYDSCNSVLAIGDEKRTFDAYGRLVKIEDGNHNTNKINYTSGRITSVVDSIGRTFKFNYSGNNLISITAPDNTKIQYAYSGNYLSTITYPDGSKAVIGYTSNKPASVTLKDTNGNNVYKIKYEFGKENELDEHRVKSVTEYGVKDGSLVEGTKSSYSYSMASKRTTVTTTELEDDCDGGNVIKTVYTFDDDGNVISDYVYSEDTGNTGVDGEVSGIHPYSADGGASIIRNNTNLLYNHTFQNGISNWEIANECCSCTNMYITSLSNKFRKYAMAIDATDSTVANNTVYQNTVSLAAGEHTFSAYVRVAEPFSGTNSGAFIRVSTLSGTVLAVSEKLVNTNSQYIRLIAPFEIKTAQSVKVEFVLDGSGLVYVCAPQLENNPFANDYNMLENGNFELGNSYWGRSTNCYIDSNNRFNMSRAARIVGDANSSRYCYQIIYPITDRSIRETFTLSGWAKGYGLPMHERNGSRIPTFRLRARVKYYDTLYKEYGTEDFTADFSPCTEEWQFTSLEFSKSKYRTIQYIYIYCDYDYNCGTAFFDDIQLVRNSIETGLTANDFAAEEEEDTSYEDTETTDYTDATEPESFAEVIDAFGNTITETTFTDGEFGTIYRSFGFTANGNDLITETDARGNKTAYEVEANTSRNKEVTDRCGNKTAYEYDNAGRTTKVISKNADGAEIAHVSYAYDAFDNMTEIARGDRMKYALKYNAFHNLESIGIDGKAESLIKYTYKNGNGRLKEISYANDDKMTATYNSVGQLVAEKWFNKDNALIAHYKYVYDNSGNIVRSIDICAKKEYNYIYNEGTLIEAITYAIELNGENIVEKTVTDNIRYIYDSDGNMTKKIITSKDGKSFIYNYETTDDKTVVKFDAVKEKVSAHSKSDSFGRKIFDELQLGSGFISRQFEYVMGTSTEEHTGSGKLKSSPTTQLVSRILLSDGRTIEYEYDAEERIAKVTDSVDGVTEYTYDALGQLLTERLNGHIINSMTYDTYGNIISKNGKAYNYGNAIWKDLLTGFDGKTIEYDAQGNPVKYLGHTLVWEKGRQLKSFDGNTYTYNANGIRTSKTINGVKHEYMLDGTKILRETWGDNTLIPLYDSEESVCGIIYNDYAYYFLKNLQGDVIAITNNKGKVVASYTYDAWGVCTIVSDNTGIIARVNPFRYRGYYYDVEIGLYYLQSRYYDACVGRFVNADNTSVAFFFDSLNFNLFAYCDNSMTNDFDSSGYASFRTRNNTLNKFVEALEKSIPNLYTQDFWCKEKQLLRIGTTNLALTISCGIAAQTNKNALFGGMFKRGTLEVSAFFGISNYVCFSFSAGITWRKAYIKIGLLLAMSRGWSGFYGGAYVEISVPTWLLAVATVAVGVACVYNPAVAAYIAKIIASIRSTARAAAAALVPIFPHIVKAAA